LDGFCVEIYAIALIQARYGMRREQQNPIRAVDQPAPEGEKINL
jgi:hypothetical protein